MWATHFLICLDNAQNWKIEYNMAWKAIVKLKYWWFAGNIMNKMSKTQGMHQFETMDKIIQMCDFIMEIYVNTLKRSDVKIWYFDNCEIMCCDIKSKSCQIHYTD